jgi:hypothetical protein
MDLQSLLILAFLLIILPIVLIVLIFLVRGMRPSEEDTQITKKAVSPKSSQLQQDTELEPVARLWHDRASGKLVVGIGEQLFREVGDLNLDQYRHMVDSYEDMRQWLGISAVENLPAGAASEPSEGVGDRPQQPQPLAQDQPVDFGAKSDSTQQKVVEKDSQYTEPHLQKPISTEVPADPVSPSVNPVDVFARALMPRSESPTPDLNVVAQINAILQEKIENTPLKQRGIRLVEQPDHSMAVMIGLTQYDSVDDVPDEQVRSVIRQAVSDWEDQMLGGEN